ncbi:MAG: hypothetical protein E4H28_07745 [Gemmatimonadales bacterium]|nr:MAG: hypothetical protein E4H28_07745 [Gemmatimonadales bacterium]
MGGTGAADIIEQSIMNQGGLQKVLDGILISNSTGTAIAITAIATTTTDKITLFGHWEVA